jgi:hypothetical protein
MKRITLLTLVLVLAACASGYDGSSLTPGQSSAAEVEKEMGKVADRRPGPDGSTVLWFPRLPAGRVSYAATIGKDGKLVSVEQRLTRQYLQKVNPGVSRQSDVSDILGPPSRVDKYPRREGDVWTYHAQGIQPQIIVVEYTKEGVVEKAYMMDDPDSRARDGLM